MRTVPRTRHYVSPGTLTLCRPILAFNYAREAYVLRGIGRRIGPVLREDRRGRAETGRYTGPERRGGSGGAPRPTIGSEREDPERRGPGTDAEHRGAGNPERRAGGAPAKPSGSARAGGRHGGSRSGRRHTRSARG